MRYVRLVEADARCHMHRSLCNIIPILSFCSFDYTAEVIAGLFVLIPVFERSIRVVYDSFVCGSPVLKFGANLFVSSRPEEPLYKICVSISIEQEHEVYQMCTVTTV
jgi:hypothetical protein